MTLRTVSALLMCDVLCECFRTQIVICESLFVNGLSFHKSGTRLGGFGFGQSLAIALCVDHELGDTLLDHLSSDGM